MEQGTFLPTLPARPFDRRLALAVLIVSTLIFAVTAPFARVQLPAVWAFIPSYQSALAINDLITAILLYAQFRTFYAPSLLLLASGYLFTALMAVVHALSFPGLFAPTGLLGAGVQTTAWIYMFWHSGFPLVVIGYALEKTRPPLRASGRALVLSLAVVLAAVVGLTLLATVGQDMLPAIMQGNGYTSQLVIVTGTVWALSLAALVVLWMRRPHSVLDLWLMVVMASWLFDIALAAVLNGGRFDLGFYAGRVYGLMAASFVLIALLLETGELYRVLARSFEVERAEAAHRISSINATLETVLDSSPLPVFSLDAEGRIATWNSAAERIFGRTGADVVGQRFAELAECTGSEFDPLQRRVMAGERIGDGRTRWRCADGRALDIVYSGAPLREQDGAVTGAVYIAEDVTDKRKLEAQLAQAQKMDAVGQLTGGIAHDFNNTLTVITGTIEILSDGVADRPQLQEIAKLIDAAATRGADLTRQLLAFARKQTLRPQVTDINALVVEAVQLLRPTLGEGVEIESILDDDAWPAVVDRSQLVTAIVNLAINARDAMPDGGRLLLETGNAVLDNSYARVNADVHPGPYVMIAVSDTGCGIPPALRDKVFEPFFTTKEVGKGTGLGLSMVYGFIKQSGGHLKIYSEEGHGTTIRLYLPQAADGVRPADASLQPGALPADGSERILVVEDDRMVREYVIAQLEGLGYRVEAAANAADALALIDDGADVDLLFTDMIMPGSMNGQQLAEAARRRRPALRLLFTSGYTEHAIVRLGRLDPDVPLLAKPYRRRDLARMVRVALAAPVAPALVD